MENYIKHIPQEVLDFIKKLEDNTKGYNIYLAGGYLRDLYVTAGKWEDNLVSMFFEPKDIDLVFIPNGETAKQLPTVERSYVNYDKEASLISEDMAARGVSHLRGLFVPELNTSDVQFIVYDKQLTIKEVAEDMDLGINQVMYNLSQGWWHTEYFENNHKNKIIKFYHEFDEARMVDRIVRMKRKFPEYFVDSNLEWEDKYEDPEYQPERGGSMV